MKQKQTQNGGFGLLNMVSINNSKSNNKKKSSGLVFISNPKKLQSIKNANRRMHRMRSYAKMAIGSRNFCLKYPQNITCKANKSKYNKFLAK